MNQKLPRVTAKDVIKVLEKSGFRFKRQSGSHKIYKHSSGRRVTVAFHPGTIIPPGTMKRILQDADLTIEQSLELVKYYSPNDMTSQTGIELREMFPGLRMIC